ncbi:MAG: hypothetical protein GX592_02240 [Clostridiales bacterium]|nr:hypothetical protein [Clostridiales bacterium]
MRKFLAAALAALIALSGFALAEGLTVGDAVTDEQSYALEVSAVERTGDGLEIALKLENLDVGPLKLSEIAFRLAYLDWVFEPAGVSKGGDVLPLEEMAVRISYAVPEAAFSGDFGVFTFSAAMPNGDRYALDVLDALDLAVEGAPAASLDGFVQFGALAARLNGLTVEAIAGRDSAKRLFVDLTIRNDSEGEIGMPEALLTFRERYAFEPERIPTPLAAGKETDVRLAFEVANAVVDSGEPLLLTLSFEGERAEFPVTPTGPEPAAERLIAVEAGYRHSFALAEDGTLWAWGSGEYGRLGTGSALGAYEPEVVELENVVQVSAGYYHSLFLTADGSVWGAGCNYDYGQLGDGTDANRVVPIRILGGARQVLAGEDYSAAILEDGLVWTWGRNDKGQLGLGSTDAYTKPYGVLLNNVAAIAGGKAFMLALTEGGKVYGWGDNTYGQLGEFSGGSLSPRGLGLSNIVQIAAGNNHAMALTADGELLVWGDKEYGQLGKGELKWDSPIAKIEAGGDMCAVRLENGAWYAWGDLFGPEPKKLDKPAAADLSLGYWHALAFEPTGATWGFGSNDYYQIGDTYEDTYKSWIKLELNLRETARPSDDPRDRDKAAAVGPFAAKIPPVSAGYYTSFAVDARGGVWAWGRSDYGQLGAGDEEKLPAPEKLEGIGAVRQAAAGDYHTLFVTEGGDLYGAGCSYDFNQLGNGTYENASEPTYIMSGVERAGAGRDISAALLSDGTLWTWGANEQGELGLGHIEKVDAPTQVSLEGVVDVAVGKRFMAALTGDGSVWMWGSNEYGQLGVGKNFEPGVPARVNLPGIVSIAAGSAHMAAVDLDGNVWTWGAGSYGQIGTGDMTNQPTPVKVAGLRDCVEIFAGGETTAARIMGGKLRIWGGYFYSTPGEESIEYYDRVRSSYEYVDIEGLSMGNYHILATDRDGNVYSIGDNSYGQLGVEEGGGNYYYYRWNPIGLNLEDAKYLKPQATPGPNSGNRAL